MTKFIICLVIFIGGYVVGAREGITEIRLGDLEQLLLYFLSLGLGIGLAIVIGYVLYLRPVRKRLSMQEEELKNGRIDLRHEKNKVERERVERIRAIVQRNEETLREDIHQSLKNAEASMRRQIEAEVENRYRRELEKLSGIQNHTQEEKRLKKTKTTSEKPKTYQASNGKIYARLREGEPMKNPDSF